MSISVNGFIAIKLFFLYLTLYSIKKRKTENEKGNILVKSSREKERGSYFYISYIILFYVFYVQDCFHQIPARFFRFCCCWCCKTIC